MMIIMEVGKNETSIRSNNMVVNLMIMKTFLYEIPNLISLVLSPTHLYGY